MSENVYNRQALAYKRVFSNSELCNFVNDRRLSKDDIQDIIPDNGTYIIFYWS